MKTLILLVALSVAANAATASKPKAKPKAKAKAKVGVVMVDGKPTSVWDILRKKAQAKSKGAKK